MAPLDDSRMDTTLSITACTSLESHGTPISISSEPVVSQLPIAASPQVITIRPMEIDDADQVRQLHEEWFPIRYKQVRCC